MKKLKVFISSVQTEFARERQSLFDYLHSDPLLGLFFEPFLYEKLIPSASMGTGTGDIIRLCNEDGLKEPEFIQEVDFRTVIWRTLKTTVQGENEPIGQAKIADNKEASKDATLQADDESGEVTGEASGEVSREVKRVVSVISREMKRSEIQKILDLKSDDFFRVNYILPALESGFIEMTFPDSPNHPNQRYRLTAMGIALKKKLQKSKKRK